MQTTSPLLVIIEGATGIGKTAVGIKLAMHFSGEIISADSRQVFRELSIGTAKPTLRQLNQVPHHFVGILSVFDNYNAWLFEEQVQSFLQSYFLQNDVAFMVGGSGLYIDAVCNGIDEIPDILPEIRKEITELCETQGMESLQNKLKIVDPEYYKFVDISNKARLIRAVEIYQQTGKPFSSFRTQQTKPRPYRILKIALERPREELYQSINQRVDEMIDAGLEQEAKVWFAHKQLNALQTVGYKEFFEFFEGKCSRDRAIELIKQHTRHYAKKQISWFKRDIATKWISADNVDEMITFIADFKDAQ